MSLINVRINLQMGTGYFVMVKEGPHFTVLPVKDWYNFRPATRYAHAIGLPHCITQIVPKTSEFQLTYT